MTQERELLRKDIARYLSQLAPHASSREAGQLLRRAELALAAPAQEPVAWGIFDEDGALEFATPYERAAHEHINDAINEHDIEGAGKWKVIPLYASPQPSAVEPDVDADQIVRKLREFVDAQKPLPADFAKVLQDNFWDLVERSPAASPEVVLVPRATLGKILEHAKFRHDPNSTELPSVLRGIIVSIEDEVEAMLAVKP